MNRKDYVSLMEAYEDITLGDENLPENEDDLGDGVEISLGGESESPEGEMEHETSEHDMQDNEEEKARMVSAHLHTIRSHAHEISTCVENGANIEPWMEEKIAIANDYIVHVANAIMYRK